MSSVLFSVVICFLELGDVKACVAVISLIVSNAAKFDVAGEILSNELQQLGLPKGIFRLIGITQGYF